MRHTVILFGFVLMVWSCGSPGSSGAGPATFTEASRVPSPQSLGADATVTKKKIRSGNLRFRVGDARREADRIRQAILVSGGEIQDEQENHYGRTYEIYLTARVPAHRLDSLMTALCTSDGRVENRSVSESDITEPYMDTQARLANKRALEARYLEILASARTVEDLLSIERELNQVRSDIETMDAQMRMVDRQVAMSTLTVSVYATGSGVDHFFSALADAFGQGWALLLEFLLFLANGWAVILFLIGAFWLFRRWRANRRIRR